MKNRKFEKFRFILSNLINNNMKILRREGFNLLNRRIISNVNISKLDKGTYSAERETDFGFERVTEEVKASKVKGVFENVAKTYDVMNDAMSFGIHRIWKDYFIQKLNPGPKTKLIDVAGGTGDIAFRFLKYSDSSTDSSQNSILTSPDLNFTKTENEVEALSEASSKNPENSHLSSTSSRNVLVCDINGKMLEVGKSRSLSILTNSQLKSIDWLECDAENLKEVQSSSFDAYTIAFGIRNCVHIENVISEAYRVLKPGGRFLCLEFSHLQNPPLKWAYDQYSFQMIPVMGQVIAGDWDSYLYLVESIRKFPTQEEFKEMIENAGFRFVNYENLSFGVVAIHSGFKI